MSATSARPASARITFALLCAAVGSGGPSLAAPEGAIQSLRQPGVESFLVPLPGRVVSMQQAQGPESSAAYLWLLVRPPRVADGERTLLRLDLGSAPRLDAVVGGLGGWTDRLAAIDMGRGVALVAGGAGRLSAFDGLEAGLEDHGSAGTPVDVRTLFEDPAFDARRWVPGRLATEVSSAPFDVEPGRLRLWMPDGHGGLRPSDQIAIPFSVERSAAGLRFTTPPVAATRARGGASSWLFVGPEALGRTRLLGYWIDPGQPPGRPEETLAALPGPESVEQSWPVLVDGHPMVVVRTQAADALNLFEDQRLRVLAWSSDRTRAGAAPTLAVELDSKRWHGAEILADDVDGDGLDDLLVTYPEGLSGSDQVVQWWRGSGGGEFERRSHRSDLDEAGGRVKLVPRGGPDDPPALLVVRRGAVELHRFVGSGRKALADFPALRAPLPPAPEKEKRAKVEVSVGAQGEAIDVDSGEQEVEILGAAELDGRPGRELLLLLSGPGGSDRLFVVRRPPTAVREPR